MTTTQCPICNSSVRLSNIRRHNRSKKCLNISQQNIIPDIYSENMDNKNYGLPPLIPERPTRRPVVPPRPARRQIPPLFPGLPVQNRVKEYKKRSYKPRRLVKFENVRPAMNLSSSMLFTLPSDRKERETKRRFKPRRVLDFNEYSRPLGEYSQAKLDYYTDIKLDNKNQIDTRIKLSRVPDNKKLTGLITTPTDIDEKFLKFVFKATQEDNRLDTKQADRVFNALQDSKINMLLIERYDGTSIRPVNDKTKKWLIDYLEGNIIMDSGYGSDTLSTFSRENIRSIIPFPKGMKINEVRSVAFFKYMNTTAIDLTRYQIYDHKQLDEHEGKSIENCYIHSLRLGGVSEAVLNRIKLDFKEGAHLPKSAFKRIAELIERNIDLTFYDQENHLRHTNYGDSKHPALKLGIIKNHVIINEPVEYTSYSIKHYTSLRDVPNWNKRISADRTSTDRFIDSLTLIKTMDECKYFTPITHSQVFAENDLQIDLTNMDNEQQECLFNIEKTKDYCSNIWYSDCESFVSTSKHSLYLIGCVSIDSDDVSIFNVCDQKEWKDNSIEQLAVWKWLKTITKDGTQDALCYFHNLKYDFNLLMQYLNIKGICEKGGAIYNVKLSYKGKEVELRDSFKLLSLGLAKFNKTFGLGLDKLEAISYEYYTPENNDVIVDKKVYREALGSNKDKTTFDLIMNEDYADSKEFNPTAYYKVYLEHDCLVLKKGLEAMDKILLDITDDRLGAYHKLTISSLTDTFMRIEGSYDGVYELTGNLREYCSRAAYGGRVHANTKYVKKLINDKPIADFDGVSLYPSAIHRLCNEVGVPTGKAKRMTNLHSDYKWCIMTVKITKVNKQQQMPIIAHRGEGSIDYLNAAPHDPIIIDKTTLEDYIKLHQIEYQILDGIYWDGEPNKTFGDVIYHLFQERLKHKKAGNKALSNILKLMLNSSYGKCLIKTTNTKKSIIKTKTYKKVDTENNGVITSKWTVLNDNNISKFIGNNFHTIKELRQINDNQWEVNQVCMDKSFNRAHIAAFILSMSKRIMNEIFDIANEMGFPIFYTDTDSMHIYDEHITPLSDEFKRIHNRELIGKQLCQFHSDFDAEGYNGNITSAGFLALGKKSYIDILQCDGKLISQQHLRMKGITKEGLEHTQRKYGNTWDTKDITKMGAMPLYLDLAKGTEVKILLNPLLDGKQKVLFDISKGQINTKDEFYRTAKF